MKGLIVFSHDMEDVEALATKALLTRAGFIMTSVTLENTLQIQTAFKTLVQADYFLFDINPSDYDFLVIPGGKYVAAKVNHDTMIKQLAKDFNQSHKLVAAICAGPRFLGQAGLLNDRAFTAFTGSEIDMPKGKYQPSKKVVLDQNIITARSAGSVYEFAYEIVSYLLGEDHAKALMKNILY